METMGCGAPTLRAIFVDFSRDISAQICTYIDVSHRSISQLEFLAGRVNLLGVSTRHITYCHASSNSD